MNEFETAKQRYIELKNQIDQLTKDIGKLEERNEMFNDAIAEYGNSIEAANMVHMGLVREYAVGSIPESNLQSSADAIEKIKSQKIMNEEARIIVSDSITFAKDTRSKLFSDFHRARKQVWYQIRVTELNKLPLDILKRAQFANQMSDAKCISDTVLRMSIANDDTEKGLIMQTLLKDYGLPQ